MHAPAFLGCRLLTMPNGERIQFANNVNFIFECDSLQVACCSPDNIFSTAQLSEPLYQQGCSSPARSLALQFASPATVSRCGMLFLSDEAIGLDQLTSRWLAANPQADPSGEPEGVHVDTA
jgi:dynein heavy chain 2